MVSHEWSDHRIYHPNHELLSFIKPGQEAYTRLDLACCYLWPSYKSTSCDVHSDQMFSFKTERVWHVTKWYVCKLRSFIQNYGAHCPYLPCGVEKVQTRLPPCQRRAGVWDMETLGSTGHTLKRRNHFRDPGCLIMQALSWGLLSLSLTLYGGQTSGAPSGRITSELPLSKFPMEIPSLH